MVLGVITASGEFSTSGVVEQEACERRGLPANLVFCFYLNPAKFLCGKDTQRTDRDKQGMQFCAT